MNQVPSQHRALFLTERQGDFVLRTNQIKTPGPGQLLLKIKATALNPVDWKIQRHGLFLETYPAIVGTDLSGEVVVVGEGVTRFAVGDKVFCQGGFTTNYASFQEYTLADEIHLAKIPSNISFDEAASIPVCLTTAYIGMYHKAPFGMGLVNPIEPAGQGLYKNNPFFVIGGASSVGQYVIQLAKFSGFSPIITTASLKHTSYLQSLGATHVLDRNLHRDDIKTQIDQITDGAPIRYIYDAISLPDTQMTLIEILDSEGQGILVLPPHLKSIDKNIKSVVALRQLENNTEILKGLYTKITEWIENGTIKPNKVHVIAGGLLGVIDGLGRMEHGQVSGIKLVVHPEETPVV